MELHCNYGQSMQKINLHEEWKKCNCIYFFLSKSTTFHSLMTISNKKGYQISAVSNPVNKIVNFLLICILFPLVYNLYIIIFLHLHPLGVERGRNKSVFDYSIYSDLKDRPFLS